MPRRQAACGCRPRLPRDAVPACLPAAAAAAGLPGVAEAALPPALLDVPQRRVTGEYAAPAWEASPARWAVAFPWGYAPEAGPAGFVSPRAAPLRSRLPPPAR